MIPYGRQSLDEDDIRAVVTTLQSDWLTQGPAVPTFEQAMASRCEAKYAVAVNSATSALHLACLAMGVGKDSLVWTSPNSFVASANCALYCGASVDFVDISEIDGNMSVAALKTKLAQAKQADALPDVVIPVHFAGQPCDMRAISHLAKEYGFSVIEDASHAVGARYENSPVGNTAFSDICIFSFHPVKIITSMEGGMALTNNPDLAENMRLRRSHGITNSTEALIYESHGPWYYEQQALGYNYRMNDVEAALGESQLRKLDRFIDKRNQLATAYNALFAEYENIVPLAVAPECYSSYHLYVVRIEGVNQAQHRQLIEALRASQIIAHLHYIPIYRQPYYAAKGFDRGYCPAAEQYYAKAITLPLFPELTASQQRVVADNLINALNQVS